MQYTEKEIRYKYSLATNKEKQIKVLAELNCCKESEIREIVKGYEGTEIEPVVPSRREKKSEDPPVKRDWALILTELDDGANVNDLAIKYHTTPLALKRTCSKFRNKIRQTNLELAANDNGIKVDPEKIFCDYRIYQLMDIIRKDDSERIKELGREMILEMTKQVVNRSLSIKEG